MRALSFSASLGLLALFCGNLAACIGREGPTDAGPDPADAGQVPVDAGDDDPDTGPVSLHVVHRVDGAALELTDNGTPYTNAAGNQYQLSRLMYFVTDVTVTMADDSTLIAPGPHYIDQDDVASQTWQVGADVAPGALKSVSFTMGIPASQNTTGSLPNPPESLMEWPDSMGGGYHYMKLEGRYLNTAGELANLRAHTGPTDGSDYSFRVTLDATGRSIPEGGATLDVVMNIDEWFKNPHTWDFNSYFQIAGIMDDATKQQELKENGADVFTLED
ncbi:MAG: hypothetical protein IT382_08575 [Deltaproteobacteria bacterium]|nr:hypothetical protein [Deltaproteobacteria bacterium]